MYKLFFLNIPTDKWEIRDRSDWQCEPLSGISRLASSPNRKILSSAGELSSDTYLASVENL